MKKEGSAISINRPDTSDIAAVAARLGYDRAAAQADEFATLIGGMLGAYDVLDGVEAEQPTREYVAHRRPGPDEDPDNAWVLRTEISTTGSGPLAGLRVAVKDNIMVAGLPMAAGSGLLAGYRPSFDATVVSRVLEAGATIAGKTNCEYFCLDGGSHTSEFGATHNPHRRGYSAGGSSSGNAVALATGQTDLALGTDQAGSIRVPASFCGIVGLKPTHGLVPYTGITPLDPVIDHAGVMSTTVAETALLLSVVAGYDDYDPRQRRVTVGDYLSDLDVGVRGLRIGRLAEGSGHPGSEPDVDDAVRAAADDLAALGAEVVEVSIPMHSHRSSCMAWRTASSMGRASVPDAMTATPSTPSSTCLPAATKSARCRPPSRRARSLPSTSSSGTASPTTPARSTPYAGCGRSTTARWSKSTCC